MADPKQHAAWRELEELATTVGAQRMESLFEADADRAARYCMTAAGITLDYSKQRVDEAVFRTLTELAEAQDFSSLRRAMFAGEAINLSEDRAVWHVALRRPPEAPLDDEVHAIRRAMGEFSASVRGGEWRGFNDGAMTDVVNIGIGGSDLGPRMVCRALARGGDGPRAHFVANVDPADLDDTLAGLDPATTLFVVTSKTFSTAETLANARAARRWVVDAGAGESDIARHFVAVSTNEAAVQDFGIERMFGFWDWVGGRYSLWSAVGLSIALACGMETFEALLAGAYAMDRHFEDAPIAQNVPALMALIGVWNHNFLGLSGHVAVPYAQRLEHLPAWLQQLEMESNGKSVTRDGSPTDVATVPNVWGSVGTNAQHAYFQMLHQGDLTNAVDFILPLSDPAAAADERERQRVANCLAQAEALMCGRDSEALERELVAEGLSGDALNQRLAARRFEGNRPSSMLVFDALDAERLGALLAAYEHKAFVQGLIWNINSFDQWGVELGKSMAGQLLGEIEGSVSPAEHDGSTTALLDRVRDTWRR